MKLLACFLLLGASLTLASEEIKLDEGVLVLTEQNFDQAITDNQYVLVEFCKYLPFLLFQSKSGVVVCCQCGEFPLSVSVVERVGLVLGSEWEQ